MRDEKGREEEKGNLSLFSSSLDCRCDCRLLPAFSLSLSLDASGCSCTLTRSALMRASVCVALCVCADAQMQIASLSFLPSLWLPWIQLLLINHLMPVKEGTREREAAALPCGSADGHVYQELGMLLSHSHSLTHSRSCDINFVTGILVDSLSLSSVSVCFRREIMQQQQ